MQKARGLWREWVVRRSARRVAMAAGMLLAAGAWGGSGPYAGDFRAVRPKGSLAYDSQITGRINPVGETDTYTLGLDAGQTLTVVVSPAAALRAAIEVRDPGGTLLASAAGSAAGAEVVAQTVSVSTAGTHSITVAGLDGTTGNYGLEVLLNAAVEMESHGGANNDILAAAEAVAGAMIEPGCGLGRGAVLGRLPAGDSADWYVIPLAAGQPATFAARASSTTPVTIDLCDVYGNWLATGVVGPGDVDGSIQDFVAPTADDYYLRIGGGPADYLLLVTRSGGFDLGADLGVTDLATAGRALGQVAPSSDPGHGDWFVLPANAGDVLFLQTRTPAGEPAYPHLLRNGLDPVLELYDPLGAPVATNDNGGADGKNAQLSQTVVISGDYWVRLFGATNTAGEYVLCADGATGPAWPFEVVMTDPADGATVTAFPAALEVWFSHGALLTSLNAADLTVGGLPCVSVTVLGGNHALFQVDPTANTGDGEYAVMISAGGVTDVRGMPLQAYAGAFTLDTAGPRVLASSILQNDVLPPGGLVFTARCSEAIVFWGPAEYVWLTGLASGAVTSHYWEISGDTLTVGFPPLGEDAYTLNVPSGWSGVTDGAGWELDGERHPLTTVPSGDGNPGGDFGVDFAVDTAVIPYPTPLAPKLPLGSMVYDPGVRGAIAPANDVDSYTLALDGGQILTVVVEPDVTLQPTVEVWAPDGSMLGSASAGAPGDDAVVQTVAIALAAGGTYTIRVRGVGGTVGGFALSVVLNAAVEEEEHGGASNDLPATAQSLDSSVFAFPGPHAAVLGRLPAGAPSDDWYALYLAAGQRVSVGLAKQAEGSVTLGICDGSGTLLAAGEAKTNLDAAVAAFEAPATGTYCLRVSGTAAEYNLIVALDGVLDAEPNDTPATASDMDGSAWALGAVEAAGASDYYRLRANAGDMLDITTATPADGPGAFENDLDPAVELYGPSGGLVAFDLDSSGDNRNARLVHAVAVSGEYTVRVVGESGSHGEYGCAMAGASGGPAPFRVLATTPADGAVLVMYPAEIVVEFNDAVLLTSLSAADLTVNGNPADYCTVLDGRRVVFGIASAAQGNGLYLVNLAAGAVLDAQSMPNEAYAGQFVVDDRPAVTFVDDDWTGPGNCGGHVWMYDAFNVLQEGVDGVAYGGTVRVYAGVYGTGGMVVGSITSRVALTRPVTVVGEDGPEQTHLVGAPDPSAPGGLGLAAVNCAHLTNGALLAGFTLTNGHTAASGFGGGADLRGGTVSGCVVRGCRASSGGGVSLYGGVLVRCTVRDNRAGAAGGVHLSGGEVSSCAIVDNTADGSGGGLYLNTGGGSVENCTISGNAAGFQGGGLASYWGAGLVNCIVYGNTAPTNANWRLDGGGSGPFFFCCITPTNGLPGGPNLDASPEFVNPAAGNFRLRAISPCVNAGTNDPALLPVDMDLDGLPRVMGGGLDIGAYEYTNQPPFGDGGGPYVIDEGTDLSLDASRSWDPNGDPLTCAWDLDGDGQYDDAVGLTPLVPWPQLQALGLPSDGSILTIVPRLDDGLGGTDDTHAASLVISNLPPAAHAGGPYFANFGGDLALDGSASFDAGGDELTWAWDLDNDGIYGDATGMTALVEWPALHPLGVGEHVVSLQVTDADDAQSTDSTTLTIGDPLSPVTFVDDDWTGPGNCGGNLWLVNAFSNIQHGIGGVQDGGTVWVHGGDYASGGAVVDGLSNRVALSRGVTVRSVPGAAATRIVGTADPDGGLGPMAARCAHLDLGTSLIGFTLTNGHTASAGELYSLTGGGGAWVSPGALVSDCVLVSNRAAHAGGGAFSLGDGVLRRCVVSGNAAPLGAGVCLFAQGTVETCLLRGNEATWGGGVYAWPGGLIRNCTVAGNAADTGGGVYADGSGAFVNCVIYANEAGDGSNWWNAATGPAYTNCCTAPTNGLPGPGHLQGDPRFVDAGGGDYRLATNSPCLDRGANAFRPPGPDLAGVPRPLDSDGDGAATVDLGAYELLRPASDSDHDGMPDGEEEIAGTDLLDPNSLLRVLRLDPAEVLGGGTNRRPVVFQSVPQKSYAIQTAPAVTGAWSVASPVQTAASNTTRIAADVPATATQMYFRVRLQAP